VLGAQGVVMQTGEGVMEASKVCHALPPRLGHYLLTEVRQVADLLVFLVSDVSSGITGSLLPVDGGICALGT